MLGRAAKGESSRAAQHPCKSIDFDGPKVGRGRDRKEERVTGLAISISVQFLAVDQGGGDELLDFDLLGKTTAIRFTLKKSEPECRGCRLTTWLA
jgi:hypothetical protein